jgi:hypothetical protein
VATRAERIAIAKRRITNILRTYTVANLRTLEQKIADAGPPGQRINPHLITPAKAQLVKAGELTSTDIWYHLAETPAHEVARRIAELDALHRAISSQEFTTRLGQVLEIAVYRALTAQQELEYLGAFIDLDAHDDGKAYRKEEPPSAMSGRHIPGGGKFDFLVLHKTAGWAGVEVKNLREWLYPDRDEIKSLLSKSFHLDVVPVLIARRIHYSTKFLLEPCGVVLWETLRQRYPASAAELASKVSNKNMLGYHDIVLGSEPDPQLIRFIHEMLPDALEAARERFSDHRSLLGSFGDREISYKEFRDELRRLRSIPADD